MSKQILRCGTSIGANLAEAKYAQSKDDFISKQAIALKEAGDTAKSALQRCFGGGGVRGIGISSQR